MLSCDKHINNYNEFITYDNISNTTGSSQYSVSHLTTGINTHVTSSSHITSSNQIITCINTQD